MSRFQTRLVQQLSSAEVILYEMPQVAERTKVKIKRRRAFTVRDMTEALGEKMHSTVSCVAGSLILDNFSVVFGAASYRDHFTCQWSDVWVQLLKANTTKLDGFHCRLTDC